MVVCLQGSVSLGVGDTQCKMQRGVGQDCKEVEELVQTLESGFVV